MAGYTKPSVLPIKYASADCPSNSVLVDHTNFPVLFDFDIFCTVNKTLGFATVSIIQFTETVHASCHSVIPPLYAQSSTR
jgi:hypothetical protein